jgi:chemotaxis protein MotA
LDKASLTGIVCGLSLIVISILIGGDLSSFVNLPGLMIVVGGTLAAILINFQFDEVKAAFKASVFVFSSQKLDANEMVATMVDICTVSRRQGLVALSKLDIESTFLKKACNLIADGADEDIMKDTLNIEIDSMKQRHAIQQDVFVKMGLFAPAFGMLGTLIGLVQMLQNLSDPDSVGPSMAVALLTTFYGSFFAFMICGPIAGKLKSRTATEVTNLEIMFEGAASIVQENNPMMVYEKLSSYIPTKLRRAMSDKKPAK